MVKRRSDAVWQGNLKDGKGSIKLGSGAFKGDYSFISRFKDGSSTNPEELIGAAHAGCFSMALAHSIAEEGFEAEEVKTEAVVHLEKMEDGFSITRIELKNDSKVPNIEEDTFLELAHTAKKNCPVSKALAAVDIELDAKLIH